MDNERLGIVGQFQKFNWEHDLTCEKQKNPDFAAISKSFGINSITGNIFLSSLLQIFTILSGLP
jgi:thiamine pyrophosphate-dependent acetolactate synthase large subunit-like protein